jgi:hypothetical protein
LSFGYFEVQWKNLDKNALQESGSEMFSQKPMYTARFRENFSYVRDGI